MAEIWVCIPKARPDWTTRLNLTVLVLSSARGYDWLVVGMHAWLCSISYDWISLVYPTIQSYIFVIQRCTTQLNCRGKMDDSSCSSRHTVLGRYPIQIRRTVLAVLYWLRLEKGTENTLLNKAFNTIKQENHPWLQNIQYSLWQVGLGNIWFNPKTCKKNSLKLLLTTRLKKIYIYRL